MRTIKMTKNISQNIIGKPFSGEMSSWWNDTISFIENVDYVHWFTRIGIILGGSLAGAVLLPILVPIVLCIFGFTCWGIMAGSAAACCQSSIGNVGAGSCFACLQGCGAGGCGVYSIIFAIGGAILGGYIAFLATASSGSSSSSDLFI